MGMTLDCWSVALRLSDGNEALIAKYFYWVQWQITWAYPSLTINFNLEDI